MIDIDKPLELGMLPPSFAFGQIHILPISTMILQWLKLFGGLETTSQSLLANLQQVHDFTTASRTQTCQQRKVAIICGTSSAKAAKFPAYRSIPGGRGAFFAGMAYWWNDQNELESWNSSI